MPPEPPQPTPPSRSGRAGGSRSRSGAARTATTRSGAVRAGTVRARARVRARQGPRRDPQRVASRRPIRGGGAAATRAARAARATGGALGLSTARRAALLAVVVCALALTVAVPLRNYVTQRHELAAVAEQQQRLSDEVARLTAERGALSDPAHIEALARERLGYVRPGETPYRVELPGGNPTEPDPTAGTVLAPAESDLPWYARVARETLGTAP